MKHFALTEWADFVRGVATTEQTESMQKHLNEDCTRCTQTAAMWTSMVAFGQREVTYEPPPSALGIAKSFFVPFKLATRQGRILRLARRTFDSLEGQPLAGLRGSNPVAQQLMCQCGSVFIDLRLDPNPGTRSISLAGQVLDSSQPGGGQAGIPVSLLSKEDTWVETTTNPLGEFQFTFSPAPHLELLFGVEGTAVLVLLPDPDGLA